MTTIISTYVDHNMDGHDMPMVLWMACCSILQMQVPLNHEPLEKMKIEEKTAPFRYRTLQFQRAGSKTLDQQAFKKYVRKL